MPSRVEEVNRRLVQSSGTDSIVVGCARFRVGLLVDVFVLRYDAQPFFIGNALEKGRRWNGR